MQLCKTHLWFIFFLFTDANIKAHFSSCFSSELFQFYTASYAWNQIVCLLILRRCYELQNAVCLHIHKHTHIWWFFWRECLWWTCDLIGICDPFVTESLWWGLAPAEGVGPSPACHLFPWRCPGAGQELGSSGAHLHQWQDADCQNAQCRNYCSCKSHSDIKTPVLFSFVTRSEYTYGFLFFCLFVYLVVVCLLFILSVQLLETRLLKHTFI